jgi:hypothetical protein
LDDTKPLLYYKPQTMPLVTITHSLIQRFEMLLSLM